MSIEEASPAGDTLYEFLTRERILSPYNPYIITTECVHMNTSDESRSFETYLTLPCRPRPGFIQCVSIT